MIDKLKGRISHSQQTKQNTNSFVNANSEDGAVPDKTADNYNQDLEAK
jgi:hypothetical protein